MASPLHVAADYLAALQALMPRGLVWPKEPDSQQSQALSGLTPVFERADARANALLIDGFPATTLELLPEWELSLGLPDPCAGPLTTVQQRRSQVLARLTGRGGQSVAYFIAYAAALGYTVTITQFSPARFGMPFGSPMNGPDWAHAWQVNAPTLTFHQFQFGVDAFGEALASFGNAVLQCEMQRVAPAQTVLIFAFGSVSLDNPPWSHPGRRPVMAQIAAAWAPADIPFVGGRQPL